MLPILRHTGNRLFRLGSPFSDLHNELHRLFSDFHPGEISTVRNFGNADLYEDDTNIYVEVELPGLNRDQIEVTLEDGVLRLGAERQEEKEEKETNYYLRERVQGKWARSLQLPVAVASDKVEANFKDGVLKITLAKEPEHQGRKIDIK